MMHDQGLSTNIGWQDKDAYGKALSSRQRQKMQRLRTWNERFRTRDSKERNLKQALGEIDRMASALGLPRTSAKLQASSIGAHSRRTSFRDGRSRASRPRRCTPLPARRAPHAASMRSRPFPASRKTRSPERTGTWSGNSGRGPARRPESYVPRFASDLELSDETERRARQLLKTAKESGFTAASRRLASRPPPSTPPRCSPTRRSPRTRSARSPASPR